MIKVPPRENSVIISHVKSFYLEGGMNMQRGLLSAFTARIANCPEIMATAGLQYQDKNTQRTRNELDVSNKCFYLGRRSPCRPPTPTLKVATWWQRKLFKSFRRSLLHKKDGGRLRPAENAASVARSGWTVTYSSTARAAPPYFSAGCL